MIRGPGNTIKLGMADGQHNPLLLTPEIRSTHLYVCGSTGTGKSKLLEYLIRQDIASWHKSKCGLLLLDPHGSLFEGITNWLAWNQEVLNEVPIVPIDLRSTDWTIGYNLLRTRKADPAVLINNIVQAMAYVWGESGTDRTPRFARWASNVLWPLYEKQRTLLEAEHLINLAGKRMRYEMTGQLSNRAAQQDWQFANALSPKDFDGQISSTVNRFHKFLSPAKLRQTFGQTGASLDFGKALEEGSIILVNLSTEGVQVSDEDASLVATLLLSDLWTAAKERGKGTDGNEVKPFYVYIDEFQNFVTPTIAKNLDQARGFGLHLTLANQFPNQILHTGVNGPQVYDSVMANARSKVVFETGGEENLRPLALDLFMGTMDPDEIKHAIYSTKVMDYVEETRTVRSQSESSSAARGDFTGMTGSESLTGGILDNVEQDPSNWNRSAADSMGTSEMYVSGTSSSESEVPFLRPVFGKELSSIEYRSIEEQIFRAMAVLHDREQRHGVARLVGMKRPAMMVTPTVEKMPTTREMVSSFLDATYKKLPFALPCAEAEKMIRDREAALAIPHYGPSDEPESAGRTIEVSSSKSVAPLAKAKVTIPRSAKAKKVPKQKDI
jgi:hypothetical protein